MMIYFAFIAAIASSLAFSSNSDHTTWKIENRTSESVVLKCESGKIVGLPTTLSFSLAVAANATAEKAWGDAYYNDGLGLNASSWACEAKGESSHKEIKNFKFSSKWGENIRLSVAGDPNGNSLSIIQGKSDLAKGQDKKRLK